jgi:cob(I)alamin adenosyltransferase
VRRAERQVVRLDHETPLSNPTILPYLNRLSSLCFVLSLWENEAAGVEKPSTAKAE